jgi:hypothetical protein
VAWKWPSAAATVVTTSVVSTEDPVGPAEITTVAPGAVEPLTTVRAPLTTPAEGDVIDMAKVAGGPFFT